MKIAICAVLFGVLSATANAAGVYSAVTSVVFYNTLEPNGKALTGIPTPFSGTCTVSGGGSVTCTDVAFSNNAPQPGTFSYTGGTWSTTVGGTSITHSETCTQSGTTVCDSALAGLTGLWTTGLQNGGATSGTCDASPYFSAGFCDQISITEANGMLTIIEQSGFHPSIPGSSLGFVYQFSTVPAPAAGWLIAPALGMLMPWMKRKRRR
jgi:hypothetical protein